MGACASALATCRRDPRGLYVDNAVILAVILAVPRRDHRRDPAVIIAVILAAWPASAACRGPSAKAPFREKASRKCLVGLVRRDSPPPPSRHNPWRFLRFALICVIAIAM